jgi:hypothetical protein
MDDTQSGKKKKHLKHGVGEERGIFLGQRKLKTMKYT